MKNRGQTIWKNYDNRYRSHDKYQKTARKKNKESSIVENCCGNWSYRLSNAHVVKVDNATKLRVNLLRGFASLG
eukprot:snap_masked-scaffold_1-processed-gene-6.26-mRNA-1 protein AED:1.00 eAED:1.00 QI:0/0/0/0/1/1/4/0/73